MRVARTDVSDHALRVLEFERVLELVAGRAASPLGAERVRSLRPSPDAEAVRSELARVGAVMEFVGEKPAWGMPTVPDARGALRDLGAEGAVLEPVRLHGVGVLLRSARLLAREIAGRPEPRPALTFLAERLYADEDVEAAVFRSVDGEGAVLDTASRELRRIRGRLQGAHARIVRQLEVFLKTLDDRHRVPDASVTIREGRYVIPVRREGKGAVGGIVHDESHTGATLFVEPPVALELMNQLRDLERQEAREIRRVLGELTARFTPIRDALAGSLDALVDFDGLHARARVALAWRASVPEILDPGAAAFRVVQGRHPLLVEAGEREVVPFDLVVDEGERAIVVSGPNTGGKSVFLKATGLIAALAQSGVVPPVDRGTCLPVFGAIFADIGDEQSIARSLSTFSAHLDTLAGIVGGADGASLVLIDEMGTGTDPAEGAALARAMLEELVARGAFSVVSSHLGELKRLDAPGSGIVNASLQFDPERMEPTYHVLKGRPGRSYGLAIARGLGFPADVLDRAEGYRTDQEADLEELLGRLERREHEADRLVRELEDERARTHRLGEDLAAREHAVREAERTAADRAREASRQALMEARAEVEAAIAEVRAARDVDAERLEEAARRARGRVEEAARTRRKSRTPRRETVEMAGPIGVGSRVRIRATGARGHVRELRSGRAVVEVGALRMEVDGADLEPLEALPEETPTPRGGGWTGPVGGGTVRTEVDLRGLRVDELDAALNRALDGAVLEDLAELRIIHGKGTGALRQRVGELLEADGRVQDFRMGGATEGGAGVTVATFR